MSVKAPIGRQTRSRTKQLMSAFENLDVQHAVTLIFDRGVDPSVMDAQLLERSLWHAVKMQNSPLVRELLKHKPSLRSDDEPMLLMAMRQSNAEMALMLIEAGADVTESDYLHAVASSREPRMHKLAVPLMERGADPRGRDACNRSVVYRAVESEALAVLEELLRRGAAIRSEDDEEGRSLLRMAANGSRAPEMLKLLFDHGCVGFEARDRLALAAIFNRIERETGRASDVKQLLDQGAPVDQTDDQGATALHRAVAWNRIKIVEILLAYGANVNRKTYRGTTPLMLAAKLPEPTIAVLLIERGANVHDCDNSCRYPIHFACEHGYSPCISLLIRLGASTDVIDQWDYTPFSLLHDSSDDKSQIFLKHFAFLTANGISFNASDLATIQNDAYSLAVYNACLTELQTMKDNLFINHLTYFDIINGKLEKLSLLTKNSEFVEQFYQCQTNPTGMTFRFSKYSRELNVAFQMAEKRRDLLITKELLVQTALKGVLPQIVLDKIARFLLLHDLSNFKRNFYLSVFQLNGK